MADWYAKSGAGAIEYAQQAYSTGNKMVPARSDTSSNVAIGRRAVWECTTGGTTNGAITWPAAVTYDTTTVTQNGVVFTARKPGFSSGSTMNWAFATIFLDYLDLALNGASAGDRALVSNNHNEAVTTALGGAAYTFGSTKSGIQYLCVDDSATPPTATATGAVVSFSVASTNMSIGGSQKGYFYGIDFKCGTGQSTTCSITLDASGNTLFDNCKARLQSTGASSRIVTGGASAVGNYKNLNVSFAAAGQGISQAGGAAGLYWNGGGLIAGTTSPTTLFVIDPIFGTIENLDLSAGASGMNLFTGALTFNRVNARNIKMPSSWSGSDIVSVPTTFNSTYTLANVAAAGSNSAGQLRRSDRYGTVSHDTTVYLSGSIGQSFKLVTNGNGSTDMSSSTTYPMCAITSEDMFAFDASAGVQVTVSVQIMANASIKNDEAWIEVGYLNDTTSPGGALASSGKSNILGSGSAYGAGVGNSSWTTTGLATPNSQVMSVTITPQLSGTMVVRGLLSKPSTTVYMHPIVSVV